ncbi:MAG: thermonuclease family protein [Alphaproteobacteria bacterium]|nr:thermonuclease family protein [Alphaproteobacteria bacterium]
MMEYKMRSWLLFLPILLMVVFDARAKVSVIDGDSLKIGKKEVRLEGMDAPEYHQYCYDSQGKKYHCGRKAFEFLQKLVAEDIKCAEITKDRYGRVVAFCSSGDKDLGLQMVKHGWAVAYTKYSDIYVEAEKEAKVNKLGIWQGKFMKPELYRALKRK